jgi:hypothetical protein
MFEANCLKERPADIVARVLEENTPCFLSARKGEQGVLMPLGGVLDEVLHAHAQVIDAELKDLKTKTEMPLYCMQVGLSGERDAIRFLDGKGKPVLALVGTQRFIRWLNEEPEPSAPKRKLGPARKKTATPRKAAAKRKKPQSRPKR